MSNYVPMALSVLSLLGEGITTEYSKRQGVITSIARRPVCDTTTQDAYLVRYSPKVEGVVETNFYNYTTVYLSKRFGLGV
jgi:hypothetical protein